MPSALTIPTHPGLYRNSILDQVEMTKRPLSGKMDVLEQLLDLICYEKVLFLLFPQQYVPSDGYKRLLANSFSFFCE